MQIFYKALEDKIEIRPHPNTDTDRDERIADLFDIKGEKDTMICHKCSTTRSSGIICLECGSAGWAKIGSVLHMNILLRRNKTK